MKKILFSLLLVSKVCFGLVPAQAPWYFGPSNVAQAFANIVSAFLGNGYALVPSQAYFGDCSDGNVTISSGITSLSRDMFYNNLTISGTGQLSFQNQRVFVCGILDLTAAPTFALDASGASGSAGTAGGGAGSNGNSINAGTNIAGRSGGNGGAGSALGAGAQGAAGTGGNCITGAAGGSGGAGGAGASTAGGATRAPAAVTNYPMRDITCWFTPQTGAAGAIFVGGGGSGGAGGGGDLVNSGGGGGGGGSSGQTIYLSAFNIKTGPSTVGGTITAWGGQGGAGGSPAAGNTGGGGGGGGGSGGWIVIKYNTRTGTAVTSLASAIFGAFGSAAGTAHGTGTNGSVGNTTAPINGLIQILNLATGKITSSTTGTATL